MHPCFTALFPISMAILAQGIVIITMFVNALYHFIQSEVCFRLTRKHIFEHSCECSCSNVFHYNDIFPKKYM